MRRLLRSPCFWRTERAPWGSCSTGVDDPLTKEIDMVQDIIANLEFMQSRVLEALAEIPDGRLHWKPTSSSTSPAEIVWHMANTERRLAAIVRGADPNTIGAEAGTRAWIEGAASGAADVSAVPADRIGLEEALAAARRETLASLEPLTPEQL